MSDKLLIDSAFSDETRVAVLNSANVLQSIDRETPLVKQLKGNIYLAKIIRVEPSLQAAFINYGGDRHGFLPFSDIHPDYYNIPESKKNDLSVVKFFTEEDKEDSVKLSNNEELSGSTEIEEASSKDFETEDYVDFDENNNPILEKEIQNNIDEGIDMLEKVENKDRITQQVFSSREAKSIDYNNYDYYDKFSNDAKNNEEEEEFENSEYKKYKIENVLKEGQYLLVQVLKEERGNKGVALTTYISIAGKYSVLMTNVKNKGGISKKIVNIRDRKILRNILNTINSNNEKSIIIRTAGVGKKPDDILRDFIYLNRLWKAIKQVSLESVAPAFIHSEDDILKRSIRDLFNNNVAEIVVEGNSAYKTIKNLASLIAPEQKTVIKEHTDRIPLFYKYGVEEQVLDLYNNKINLPSGGSIVIDQTEALVAIDVNSGKSTKQSNIEEMAVANNMEAAKEIARQIILRDLGGLIVIDFIDMFDFKSRRTVEKTLRDAFEKDRAKVQFDKISMLGLLEMSRQRLNASFGEKVSEKCHHCEGRGMVKSKYIIAENILRNLKYCTREKNYQVFSIVCSEDIAEYLLNYKRNEIKKIEQDYTINIFINGDAEKNNNNYEIKRRESLNVFEKMDLFPTMNKGKVNEAFDDEELYDGAEEEINGTKFSDDCYYSKTERSVKSEYRRQPTQQQTNNARKYNQNASNRKNTTNKNHNGKGISIFEKFLGIFRIK